MDLLRFLDQDVRVLITGITSIHGWPIYRKLMEIFPAEKIVGVASPKTMEPCAANIHKVCITERGWLKMQMVSFRPSHVIHCGGVCDLDVCEDRPDWARLMNVGGAKTIREVFSNTCHITYISSDLVFSGAMPPPGGYDEGDIPEPVSVVGKTYLAAEAEISRSKNSCIVRVGLPLGDSFNGGKGAVDWIESRFKRCLPVTMFYDEIRSCVPCEDLADKVLFLALTGAKGIFHCGGDTPMSLFDIGQMVLRSGSYSKDLLTGASRLNDFGGPPRAGNICLNSCRLERYIERYSSNASNCLERQKGGLR